jgi:hypothetical protein
MVWMRGKGWGMTDDRVASRAAHPLPEELPLDPGTDPETQASALLAESELRTAQAQGGVSADGTVEHRTSAETTP